MWTSYGKLFRYLAKKQAYAHEGQPPQTLVESRLRLSKQVVAWYDNENSYTSQMVRTIKYFAEL